MPKVKEKTFRVQHYRKEWEKEAWASGWLSVGKTSTKACCRVCDKQLSVGKSELINHTKSKAHINLSKNVASSMPVTSFVWHHRSLNKSQSLTINARKTMSSVSGNVAIVTGASSGIGQAIARSLASAGVKVALAARRKDELDKLVDVIRVDGGTAFAVKTDVTDRQQVKRLVRQTHNELGPVDILVNCAGVMYYTMMENLHEDEWERQIDVNCKGVMNGIGAVLKGMLERGRGHIVNISSDAGRKAFPGLAVYSGTKYFVEGMSQALRQEVAGSGVKVTCIQPGDVKTPLLALSTDQEAVKKFECSKSMQVLEPEDIGQAVLYAVTQPSYVAVNEILVEPREAPI